MPKTVVSQEWELQTRNQFTKVDATLTLTVNGREIPSGTMLGDCVDTAISRIQERIKELYATVPERV